MDSPTSESQEDLVFRHHRVLPFTPQNVFEAFAQPELLARWWGPKGFTNTFELFDFKPGGRWKYVMHGPNDGQYQNESTFLEVDASRVVIHHVSKPRYRLTITLTAHEQGTAISWIQEFEDRAVATRLKHIVEPANEENLDRLQSLLSSTTTPSVTSPSTHV